MIVKQTISFIVLTVNGSINSMWDIPKEHSEIANTVPNWTKLDPLGAFSLKGNITLLCNVIVKQTISFIILTVNGAINSVWDIPKEHSDKECMNILVYLKEMTATTVWIDSSIA